MELTCSLKRVNLLNLHDVHYSTQLKRIRLAHKFMFSRCFRYYIEIYLLRRTSLMFMMESSLCVYRIWPNYHDSTSILFPCKDFSNLSEILLQYHVSQSGKLENLILTQISTMMVMIMMIWDRKGIAPRIWSYCHSHNWRVFWWVTVRQLMDVRSVKSVMEFLFTTIVVFLLLHE